jgi:hypothetical protein
VFNFFDQPGNPGGQEAAQGGGPLANLQGDVARTLTGNGMGNYVYLPGGPGGPVIQVPNPARWGYPNQYQAAPPVSRRAPSTGSRGRPLVGFLLLLVALLTVAVIVLAIGR